jgi:outer membrane protein TolC
MWKSIALARESLRIEQQKYDLGKGAIVDVLDAQAALLESETTYYRVLSEFHTALAQLKFAIGEE